VTYLLDTCTCIDYMRNSKPSLTEKVRSVPIDQFFVCSIIVAELKYGVEKSPPLHREKNAERLVNLRRTLASLPFDDDAAEHY